MAFKFSVEFITSFAYFVEHLDVIFEPNETYCHENHQKVIEAIDFLLANDTKQILKKVSCVTIHIKVTYLNK